MPSVMYDPWIWHLIAYIAIVAGIAGGMFAFDFSKRRGFSRFTTVTLAIVGVLIPALLAGGYLFLAAWAPAIGHGLP